MATRRSEDRSDGGTGSSKTFVRAEYRSAPAQRRKSPSSRTLLHEATAMRPQPADQRRLGQLRQFVSPAARRSRTSSHATATPRSPPNQSGLVAASDDRFSESSTGVCLVGYWPGTPIRGTVAIIPPLVAKCCTPV